MKNPSNPKERNLVKGALRRVFSRSELRRSVLEDSKIAHKDPKRPRVTKWGRCSDCKEPSALYQMQVDHIIPLVPVDRSLEDMSWDEVVNRLWCDKANLQILCLSCHKIKCTIERKLRAEHKKRNKK